jgi:hypothetical protein
MRRLLRQPKPPPWRLPPRRRKSKPCAPRSLLYLAIAVGSVTHRDLLFENPVKLPFLNADLPVRVFFVVGPGLFLIVHAYVLRMTGASQVRI